MTETVEERIARLQAEAEAGLETKVTPPASTNLVPSSSYPQSGMQQQSAKTRGVLDTVLDVANGFNIGNVASYPQLIKGLKVVSDMSKAAAYEPKSQRAADIAEPLGQMAKKLRLERESKGVAPQTPPSTGLPMGAPGLVTNPVPSSVPQENIEGQAGISSALPGTDTASPMGVLEGKAGIPVQPALSKENVALASFNSLTKAYNEARAKDPALAALYAEEIVARTARGQFGGLGKAASEDAKVARMATEERARAEEAERSRIMSRGLGNAEARVLFTGSPNSLSPADRIRRDAVLARIKEAGDIAEKTVTEGPKQRAAVEIANAPGMAALAAEGIRTQGLKEVAKTNKEGVVEAAQATAAERLRQQKDKLDQQDKQLQASVELKNRMLDEIENKNAINFTESRRAKGVAEAQRSAALIFAQIKQLSSEDATDPRIPALQAELEQLETVAKMYQGLPVKGAKKTSK